MQGSRRHCAFDLATGRIGGLCHCRGETACLFGSITSTDFCGRRLTGTVDNKRQHLEWVVKVQGGGGTDPREALKLALGLKPDVIYLLTDGVFDPKVAAEVTKLNRQKVSIHTFCFGNDSGESLLQETARKNNGTSKFVP